MDYMAEAAKINSWAALVPPSWAYGDAYSKALIIAYSSSLTFPSSMQALVCGAKGFLDSISQHPVEIAILQNHESAKFFSASAKSNYKNGSRQIDVKVTEEEITEGGYVCFLSPTLRVGVGFNEGIARNAIELARGMFFMLAGHTAADQKAFEASVDLTKPDRLSASSDIVETFAMPDMFCFSALESMAQLSERVQFNHAGEFRQRVSVALTFLGRATSEMDSTIRFSSMWIALEVVAGGYGKVEKLLSTLAGSNDVKKQLGEIKRARDNLFHHGQRYNLSQEQERLICAAIASEIFRVHGINDGKLQSYFKSAFASE